MQSVVVPALTAIVLALAGGTFWIAGEADQRVADVHVQLATLQYGAANRASAEVEQSLELERRLPIVGREATDDLHGAATTAKYWQSDYAGIEPQHDASGAVSDTDPAVLLTAANAQFRASQAASDRLDTIRRLDGAIKSYSEALKAPGQQIDAAYNFEYAVRLRDALGKARPAASGKNVVAKKAADDPGDLPAGATLHGHPGAPPTKTEMSQFKIVIPKRGEERKDNPEAGKGGQKIRRG